MMERFNLPREDDETLEAYMGRIITDVIPNYARNNMMHLDGIPVVALNPTEMGLFVLDVLTGSEQREMIRPDMTLAFPIARKP